MTYEELLDWAKAQNKTESDIIKFEVYGQATYFHDLSLGELVEEIEAGNGRPLTSQEMKDYFEAKNAEDQTAYLAYLKDFWSQQGA
jgi:hypothetical protein